MARSSVPSPVGDAEPRVRRGYFECRFGQLHIHNAIPAGGGFDEATALICLHHSPLSGRIFQQLLRTMGRDRSVYAPDLPGFGGSDPPHARPAIEDYAAAVGDFCATMRFRQIDVLGFQSGSLVAAELALALPAVVRRVVLIGVPLPTEAEREAFRRAPWPAQPTPDGSYLMVEWQRTLAQREPTSGLDTLARDFAEKMHNGPNAWWGMHAALHYPARERLPQLTHSVLVVRPKDELWDQTLRARDLIPKARLVDRPEPGRDLLDRDGEDLARLLGEFLRG
jgi:pimeloyl-ACP methyl ester carboxylesterase